MGIRDLKCRNGAQYRNLREKLSKTGPVENFLLRSKSTVNIQRMTCAVVAMWWHLKAYVVGREAQQARGVRGARGWAWELAREARGEYWRRVATREARAREAETLAGTWRRVWCSFWLFLVGFCSGLVVLSFYSFSMVVEWADIDIRELQVLWAWRWWLASDNDYWMKARAVEERRRCPQEPKSQRNGSDTMLTI